MEIPSVLRLQIEAGINLLFITVMTGFLVYIFINSKRTRILFCYCFMHTLLILLFAFNFAASISPDISIRWYCITATYIIKLFFDVTFILYIHHFFNPGQKLISLVLVIVHIAAGSILIITNPLHHLFVRKMTDTETVFGIFFYIIMGAGYVIQTVGMLCIMKFWIRRLDNQSYRILSSVLALASILFLHLSMPKIISMPVDIFPLLILAGFAVYFIGAYKYGMFDTISYGSIRSVEMYTDALMIIGKKGKVHYKNKACDMLDEKTLQEILVRLHNRQPQQRPAKWIGSKTDMEIPQTDGTKYFSVSVKPVRSGLLSTGKTIIIIHDNTKIVSAINSLSEKNQYLREMNESIKMLAEDAKKLAILSERNRLAKEIHDVIGHSLILALNTMESNKLLVNDIPSAMRRINQAVSEISSSLDEVSSARGNEPDTENTSSADRAPNTGPAGTCRTMLSERLDTLAAKLSESGITLELAAMDDLDGCRENVINTIYRVCQESVTNAIKHGQASRITISIRSKAGTVELFVVDNGKGCLNFIKGTGLFGMEERVRELNGTISFGSFEDREGFMVRAVIPI